jgi:hypothetical protein
MVGLSERGGVRGSDWMSWPFDRRRDTRGQPFPFRKQFVERFHGLLERIGKSGQLKQLFPFRKQLQAMPRQTSGCRTLIKDGLPTRACAPNSSNPPLVDTWDRVTA